MRTILIMCVWCVLLVSALTGSAVATEVTINPVTLPNFNVSGLRAIQTTVVTANGNPSRYIVRDSGPKFPQEWVDKNYSGFKVQLNGVLYEVEHVLSPDTIQLTQQTPNLGVGVNATIYPFVELRVYALQTYTPFGAGYVVQAGSPGGKDFFYRKACSVIQGQLYLPEVRLPATLDAVNPIERQARLAAWLYRTDGSQIRAYDCFTSFQLPETPTPTTWVAVCTANSAGTLIATDNRYYTASQINSLLAAYQPGGANKQIQFNNNGVPGGAAGFEYQSGASPNVSLTAQNAAYVGLQVQGAVSGTGALTVLKQNTSGTGNFLEAQNSSGTVLLKVKSSGALNLSGQSSPVVADGDLLYSLTSKAFVIGSDAQARYLSGVIAAGSADVASSSTSPTSLLGSDGAEYNGFIPANHLKAGKAYRISGGGYYNGAGGGTAKLTLKLGSTVLAVSTSPTLAGVVNRLWRFEILIQCQTTGVSGTVQVVGAAQFFDPGSGLAQMITVPLVSTSAVTVNTTVTQTIDLLNEWSITGTTMTVTAWSLEELN